MLGVRDGTMLGKLHFAFSNFHDILTLWIEKTSSLQENVNPGLLQSMREGNPLKLTGVPQRKPQENDAIPKIAPKWLKYDKQVRGISLFNLLYSSNLFFINRSSNSMPFSKNQWLRTPMRTIESGSASSIITLMMIQSISSNQELKIVAFLKEYFWNATKFQDQKMQPLTTHGGIWI